MTRFKSDIDITEELKRALQIEKSAIDGLIPRLGPSFEQAVRLLFNCNGKVIVTGMGKSGHIANKIAATFASTGTPALFLHPAEAIHGDLGILTSQDVVVALSNSGSTEEILRLLGPFRRIGVPIVAMTGRPDSELANRAQVNLDVSVAREACPLNLAPTASTTAALAMGDAIAVTLLRLRDFRAEDYAVFHPGGNLGKKLITTVADIMDSESVPSVPDSSLLSEVVDEILNKRYGVTSIVDQQRKLIGAFSLGDLLRLHIKDRSLSFMKAPVRQFMNSDPKAIQPHALAAQALNMMENSHIRALFVINEDAQPVGIIGIYEVLKAIDY